MKKTTLNPFENAKRTAKGTGGGTITPATSEKLGGVKIGEGVNVSADGTISVASYTPPAYSTTEHLTGRKWVDGSDIYEKTFYFENGISILGSGTTVEENTEVNLIISVWASDGIHGYAPTQASVEDNVLKAFAIGGTLATIKYITYQYTKPTV